MYWSMEDGIILKTVINAIIQNEDIVVLQSFFIITSDALGVNEGSEQMECTIYIIEIFILY